MSEELLWMVRRKDTGEVRSAHIFADDALAFVGTLPTRAQPKYEVVHRDKGWEAITTDGDAIPEGRSVALSAGSYGHGYAILAALKR